MTDPTTNPIVVNGSPTSKQIEAGLRQFVSVAGPVITVLAATGWGKKIGLDDLWVAFGGSISAVATIVAVVWGQVATRVDAKKSVALVGHVNDATIATTK